MRTNDCDESRPEVTGITRHAVDKCMDLLQIQDRNEAFEKIINMYNNSKEEAIDEHLKAIRILRAAKNPDDIKDSKYFRRGQYRITVSDSTIVTFELAWKDRKKRRKK